MVSVKLQADNANCLNCILKLKSAAVQVGDSPQPNLALGARMEVLVAHDDWVERLANLRSLDSYKLPSKDQIRDSLWMSQSAMAEAREFISYECHDLRIVRIGNSGELEVAYCFRKEPHSDPASLTSEKAEPGTEIHTGPINEFAWPIGGRRMCPKPGSPLDGKFSIFHSAILKASQEAGIDPKNIIGIYELGVGITEFNRNMNYFGFSRNDQGEIFQTSQAVYMPAPQRTTNRNLVIFITEAECRGDHSVGKLHWLSESDFKDPAKTGIFSAYEMQFLAALFGGWQKHKKSGEVLRTFGKDRE